MNPRPPVRQVTLKLDDNNRTIPQKQAPRKKDKNKSQLEQVITVFVVRLLIILMIAVTITLLIGLFKLAAFLITL